MPAQIVRETTYSLSPAPILVAGLDYRRLALIVSIGAVSNATLTTVPGKAYTAGGLLIASNNPQVHMSIVTHGDLVKQEWYASAPAVSLLTVIELFEQ